MEERGNSLYATKVKRMILLSRVGMCIRNVCILGASTLLNDDEIFTALKVLKNMIFFKVLESYCSLQGPV